MRNRANGLKADRKSMFGSTFHIFHFAQILWMTEAEPWLMNVASLRSMNVNQQSKTEQTKEERTQEKGNMIIIILNYNSVL